MLDRRKVIFFYGYIFRLQKKICKIMIMKQRLILLIDILILPYIMNYHVHFYVFCDDFCLSVTTGGVTTQFPSVSDKSQPRNLTLDIEITNEVSILIENDGGQFGFAGKIDYYYFFISSNDISYWSVSDSLCKSRTLPNHNGYNNLKQFSLIGIKSIDNDFRKKKCTFSYKFSLCEENQYVINKDQPFSFESLIKVEKTSYFNQLQIQIDYGTNFKGELTTEESGVTSTHPSSIKTDQMITYTVNERLVTDVFKISISGKDMRSTEQNLVQFATCPITVVVCESNCAVCSDTTYKCTQCESGYYPKEDDEYKCYLETETFDGFYFDSTNNKFMKCHQNCKECQSKGNSNNNLCDVCIDTLIKQEYTNASNILIKNCVTHCKDVNFYLNDDKCVQSCKSPYNKYILSGDIEDECVNPCPAEKPKLDSLTSSEIYCVEQCESPREFYNPNTLFCISSCPSDMFYIEEDKICLASCPSTDHTHIYNSTQLCVEECKNGPLVNGKEYHYTDNISGNCLEECEQSQFVVVDTLECYISCPDEYPLSREKECVVECTEPYDLIDNDSKKCLTTCNGNIPNIYEHNGECIAQCPIKMKPDINGKCIIDLHLTPINETDSEIDLDLNDTKNIIDEFVIEYTKENVTINGEGFVVQVYPSDTPPIANNNVSSIDLFPCELILRRYYQIPSDESLIIVKYDIENKSEVTGIVEYSVYDIRGKKLNLDVCNDIKVNISYPINSDIDISISQAEEMMNVKGIDIYDGQSDFYNNICEPYSENGLDMVLEDRRFKYYKNVTFCEKECNDYTIDFDAKQVKCDCYVKTSFMSENYVTGIKAYNNFRNKIHKTNLYINKCYSLLFHYRNLRYNIAFWLFLFIFISQTVFILCVRFPNKTFLYSLLNKISKGSPNYKEVSSHEYFQKTSMTNTSSDYQELGYKSKFDDKMYMQTKSRKQSNDYLSTFPVEEDCRKVVRERNRIITEIYLKKPKLVNNYPFWLSHLIDRRNCFYIFWSFMVEKHILLFSIFDKGKIKYPGVTLSLLVIQLSLCFSFNAIFYFNSMISERFYHGSISLIHFIEKTFLSFLIGFLILKTLRYFHFFPIKFHSILTDISNNKILCHYILTLLSKLRVRLCFYFSFTMAVTLFFWYYLTIFCIVYYHTQLSWLIHSVVSIVLLLVLSVIYSSLFAILRKIGIKYKYEWVFNMSILLKDIY